MNTVSLHCIDCDNTNCEFCPIGTYIPHDSLRGCIRKVGEEKRVEYLHYINEVLPFLSTCTPTQSKKIYYDTMSLLDNIYQSPITHKLDKNGKVIFQ